MNDLRKMYDDLSRERAKNKADVSRSLGEIERLDAMLSEKSAEVERLRAAAILALDEMRNTVAPRDSFTDAVDALDAALFPPNQS